MRAMTAICGWFKQNDIGNVLFGDYSTDMNKELIYLASPYSSYDKEVVSRRVDEVSKATATLIERGHLIFSPIVHSHPIAHLVSFDPLNHAPDKLTGWMAYDFAMIDNAAEVWVLQIDGWEQSNGVQAEVGYAMRIGKPVKFVTPTLEILSYGS
jgi:nucleoside 2-deoxyribosyltransferase